MMTCQEMMEPCIRILEANREKSEATAEHEEVPKEEATVETIEALEIDMGTAT
jgi:hypothetical protein